MGTARRQGSCHASVDTGPLRGSGKEATAGLVGKGALGLGTAQGAPSGRLRAREVCRPSPDGCLLLPARREDTRMGRPLCRRSVWDPGSRTMRTGLLSAMETRQGSPSCSPDPTSSPSGSLQPGEPFPPRVLMTENRKQAVRERVSSLFRKRPQLCLVRLQVCDQGLWPQVGWARGHLGRCPARGQRGVGRARHRLPEPEFGAPGLHSSWTSHGPRSLSTAVRGHSGSRSGHQGERIRPPPSGHHLQTQRGWGAGLGWGRPQWPCFRPSLSSLLLFPRGSIRMLRADLTSRTGRTPARFPRHQVHARPPR